MTMTSFENGPQLEGWHVQPGKHCGLLCVDLSCPVCGEWVNVPQSVVLGEN